MADKRISQLVDRGTIANNDVVPIVVSGATTTNKATISSIQTFMQGNLDLGVTSVGITLGSTGTDVSVSGSPITSSGNITINLPTASATNRGLLSAADWVTFNSKQDAGSFVTLNTTQTITAQKTFTTSGSSDTMIISHGSGSGFALDVLKAGNGEAIRVTKSSGTGNAMTISGGNFEAGTIVKTGGTSSQFLKADGSVDSNTYLTTGSAGSTYVPYSGASANVDLGIYSFTSNTITSQGGMTVNGGGSNAGQIHFKSNAIFSLLNGYGTIASGTSNSFLFYQTNNVGDFRGANLNLNSITASATRTYTLPDASGTLALTSDIPSLAGYVTLATAQTITGLKTFSTSGVNMAEFTSTYATGGVISLGRSGVSVGNIGNSGSLTVGILDDLEIRSGSSKNIHLRTDATQFTLSPSGGATLFSANSSTPILILNTTGTNQPSGIGTQQNGGNKWAFGTNFGSGDDSWNVYNYTAATRFLTIASTGAATFSSSVGAANALLNSTSTQLIIQNADGGGNAEKVGMFMMSNDIFKLSSLNDNNTTRVDNIITANVINGNVGIGTASPNIYNLTNTRNLTLVNDAGYGVIASVGSSGNGGEIDFGTSSIRHAAIASLDGSNLGFYTNGSNSGTGVTERMRITSGGQVQIGGSTGTYLDFSGTVCRLFGGSGTDTFGLGAANAIYYQGDSLRLYPTADNSRALGLSSNRYTAVWAVNGTIQTSDEREKKDIMDSDLGLDFVNKLRPVSFKWKVGQNMVTTEVLKDEEGNPILDEEGKEKTESVITPREGIRTHYGLIAQEVEELLDGKDFGGFIHDEETDIKGLRYDQFVPLLIKAIQELKTEIDSLKNQMQ